MFLFDNKQAGCMQDEPGRRTNPQRSAEMRARLVAAARRLFVAQGFAATSTPAIVAAAGVTRGALYHHFEDKQAIFRAVVEAESAAVAAAIEAADRPEMTATDRLLAGGIAYLRAMREPGRVRLLLLDGPAVLGRAEMRRIEAEHGEGSLLLGLREALAASGRRDAPAEVLAALLSAMFERAALEVSEGAKQEGFEAAIRTVLLGVVEGRKRHSGDG
jgi:AcrR family transcriptional regulator